MYIADELDCVALRHFKIGWRRGWLKSWRENIHFYNKARLLCFYEISYSKEWQNAWTNIKGAKGRKTSQDYWQELENRFWEKRGSLLLEKDLKEEWAEILKKSHERFIAEFNVDYWSNDDEVEAAR